MKRLNLLIFAALFILFNSCRTLQDIDPKENSTPNNSSNGDFITPDTESESEVEEGSVFQVTSQNVTDIYFINCSPSYKGRGQGGSISSGAYEDRHPVYKKEPLGLGDRFPTKIKEIYNFEIESNTFINSNLNSHGNYGGWLSRYYPDTKILVYYHYSQTPDLNITRLE